jgi:hypothetical protein
MARIRAVAGSPRAIAPTTAWACAIFARDDEGQQARSLQRLEVRDGSFARPVVALGLEREPRPQRFGLFDQGGRERQRRIHPRLAI